MRDTQDLDDSECVMNHEAASADTTCSALGSSNRCVAPGTTSSRCSHRNCRADSSFHTSTC